MLTFRVESWSGKARDLKVERGLLMGTFFYILSTKQFIENVNKTVVNNETD